MPEFHETQYGRRFFDGQLPTLIDKIGDLAKAAMELAGAVNRLSVSMLQSPHDAGTNAAEPDD